MNNINSFLITRTIIVLIAFVFSFPIQAQVYEEAVSFELLDLSSSTISVADFNSDDYPDVFITGKDSTGQAESRIYFHDGNIGFIYSFENDFVDLSGGDVVLNDFNGDSNIDILYTGLELGVIKTTRLYINNGQGDFSLDNDNSFENLARGGIDAADVDDDGDIDVLLTGQGNDLGLFSLLYLNDGNGLFSPDLSNSFEGVYYSDVRFFDFDNDADFDIILIGLNETNDKVGMIYENDGTGGFSENNDYLFGGRSEGVIGLSDIDNDGDIDVLTTGYNSNSQRSTSLYRNDIGVGFVPISNVFLEYSNGDVSFADITGDGFEDLIMAGYIQGGIIPVVKFYLNQGDGNFLESFEGQIPPYGSGETEFVDLNGDSELDLIMSGLSYYDGGFQENSQVFLLNPNLVGLDEMSNPVSCVKIQSSNDSGSFEIYTSSEESGNAEIKLFTLEGKEVLNRDQLLLKGTNSVHLSEEFQNQWMICEVNLNNCISRRLVICK